MDPETIKWIVSQGIGAVLALGMFLLYRKDVHEALNSWQSQTKILTDLVKEVSTTLQAHTSTIQEMERSLPHACPMADEMAAGAVEIVTKKIGIR